jgi:hypothetical protein
MMRSLPLLAIALLASVAGGEPPSFQQIDQPPHNYRQRTPVDPFTRLKDDLESGGILLDTSSEKAFVTSLLSALGVPVSSQMLVFSTTSLQLRLITQANPRALYFTDEMYVGYVPGGRIEVEALDPELGGIFYIFDIPVSGQKLRAERSERCMNCHASAENHRLPGLLVKSVVPGQMGGSLTAFRQEIIGHGVPFDQRLGGWYVTGKFAANHWGNIIGALSPNGLSKSLIQPGQYFNFAKYPAPTSDILPELLLEHQAGFVNRVVEASYRARTNLHASGDHLSAEQDAELEEQARSVTRYLLFADEVPLPAGGVESDAVFRADFLRDRRAVNDEPSLKDFELRTRLFRYRCSYMIYSSLFRGLPPDMKQRIYRRLAKALSTETPDLEYAYLPPAERQTIAAVLRATLPDLPAGW